ncbi:MAG: hypothetical protein JWR38_5296 [Mucilaginibacter sp.]|nr:hypothetical protein [Mucilaginibacter sp.]
MKCSDCRLFGTGALRFQILESGLSYSKCVKKARINPKSGESFAGLCWRGTISSMIHDAGTDIINTPGVAYRALTFLRILLAEFNSHLYYHQYQYGF